MLCIHTWINNRADSWSFIWRGPFSQHCMHWWVCSSLRKSLARVIITTSVYSALCLPQKCPKVSLELSWLLDLSLLRMESRCWQVQLTGLSTRKCTWHRIAPQDGHRGTVAVNELAKSSILKELLTHRGSYLCYDVAPKERSNDDTLSLLIPCKFSAILIFH